MKEIIERAEMLGYEYYHHSGLDRDKNIYMQLCLIQKWIYEKFGIWISIIKEDVYFIYELNKNGVNYLDSFDTLPQSLEEGIKKALEILER